MHEAPQNKQDNSSLRDNGSADRGEGPRELTEEQIEVLSKEFPPKDPDEIEVNAEGILDTRDSE